MNSVISVIIPVYKVEKYLDKCLESIVQQTYANLEIILVDDGSPDMCPKKCDDWAKKDNRIKVIHKANEGLGFARNSGLDIAKGDYVTFVDSDDYLANNTIEILLSIAEQYQSDLVEGKHVIVHSNGIQYASGNAASDRTVSKSDAIKELGISKELSVYSTGKLYRKHIFEKIRYKPLKCAEDMYIIPDIIERCKTISFASSAIYFYYQNESSIVHTKGRIERIDNLKATLHMARFLLKHKNIQGASAYYYSAICQYYATENDKEAYAILKDSFTKEEIKLFEQYKTKKMAKIMFFAKIPFAYKFYRYIKK